MDISFKFDPEILLGVDTLSMAGTVCSRYGQRIMIAADRNLPAQTVNRLKDNLVDSGIESIVFDGIEEESTADMADNIVELASAAHCNAIIGFGGRNTQIISRMAAIMAPMKISSFELLEGRLFQKKILPFIAIPTEGLDIFSLSQFFIAADPRTGFIKSVQSPHGLYAAIILDSNLFSCLSGSNAGVFIFNSLFAAVEAYCSAKANFFSDALLERALSFYAKLLKGGTASPGGIDAGVFAQAGFLTALGISASSPGAGAALSFAIFSRFPAVKQLSSAVLFPFIADKLINARPEKMARIASFLGNAKAATVAETAASVVDGIKRSMTALKIQPDLKKFNIPLDKATTAVEEARNLEFVANSPWIVSEEAAFELIKQIL